ncbi:MAG: hypothetical protein LBT00_00870 [Spirochaetaceae bacterium]|nr:hypothetical protein [Spirochaetaceae bacterium]
MNMDLLNALKKIVSQYGGLETLGDAQRVKALLADLATGQNLKPQKNALIACIKQSYPAILQNVLPNERGETKAKLAERLNREEGLDPVLCVDTLDLLEVVLFGEVSARLEPNGVAASLMPLSISENVNDDIVFEMEESGDLLNAVFEKDAEIARLTADTERLTADIKHLTQEKNQINNENRKIKKSLGKMKSGLIAAITIGVVGIVISIVVGYNKYRSMESELGVAQSNLSATQTNLSAVQSDLSTAQSELHSLESSLLPINVTAIKVGNRADEWLTPAGEKLYASQMRYLSPVITCNAILDEEVTFYIKIIQPNGGLFNNSAISPKGYTNSTTAQMIRGNDQTFNLIGWGNADRSLYWAGEWTVEVWYNDACLRSEKVMINSDPVQLKVVPAPVAELKFAPFVKRVEPPIPLLQWNLRSPRWSTIIP